MGQIGLLLDAPDMGGEEEAGSGKGLDLPTKYTNPLPSSNHFSYHQHPQVLWAHLLLNTHSLAGGAPPQRGCGDSGRGGQAPAEPGSQEVWLEH